MMSSMHQSSKGSKVRNIQIKENAMIYLQNRLFGRQTDLSPYISFEQLAMFTPWRSQKSLRKHKDPITGNSFIVCTAKLIIYYLLNLV